MRSITILFLLVFISNSAAFQNNKVLYGKLSGNIVDSVSNTPIEYAVISLWDNEGKRFYEGTITASDGHLSFNNISMGVYKLKITMAGYQTKNMNNIVLSESIPTVELGNIKMSIISIAEINVVAQKPTMEFHLDKVVYNVTNSNNSPGIYAKDILRNIPLVSVNSNGDVSLKGSSKVNVLVDGRMSELTATNILDQLPVSSIDRIEVITNPSAKYESEGSAGILNIILKQNSPNYLSSLINIGLGTKDNYNTAFNFNYSPSSLNIFFYYNNNFYFSNPTSSFNGINYQSSSFNITENNMNSFRKTNSHNFRFGINYKIDELNSVSTGIVLNFGKSKINSTGITLNSNNSDLIQQYNLDNSFINRGNVIEYNLSYKRKFLDSDNELSFVIFYSNANNYKNYELLNNFILPKDQSSVVIINEDDNRNRFLSFDGNYFMSISEFTNFESGLRFYYRVRNSYFDTNKNLNVYSDSMVEFAPNNHFKYDEANTSAYMTLSSRFSLFNYEFGLRFENSNNSYRSGYSITEQKENTSYTYLFPTVHLKYNIDTVQTINASYSKRMDKPSLFMLNPFINFYDLQTAISGNPNLHPSITHSYEIGYNYFTPAITITILTFMRYSDNEIGQTSIITNKGVYLSKYENNNRENSNGLSVNITTKPFSWLNMNGGCSYYHVSETHKNFQNEYLDSKYSFENIYCNLNVRLPRQLNIIFNCSYLTGLNSSRLHTKGNFYSALTLRKTFFEDRLTASINIRDLFNSSKTFSETFDKYYYSKNDSRNDLQVISLNISYNFNKNKNVKVYRPEDDTGSEEYLK